MSSEEVEFKTLDGVILQGRLYPANQNGPGVVLSQFNCVKEMSGLPEIAARFQEAGITALIYDPRSTGQSGGNPRNDIDPVKQTEDFSDALTFLGNLHIVDPDKLGIWGISFGGAVALSVASLDKRVKVVLAICPASEYQYSKTMIPKVLAKCIKDRESQMKENEPYCIPMLNSAGENPAGFNFGVGKAEGAKIVSTVAKLGMEGIAAHHVNRTTIQTYYKLIMWQPSPLWRHIGTTPVLFVVAELDTMCPPDVQRRHFDALSGPKQWHLVEGKGHLDLTGGGNCLVDLVKLQIDFIYSALQGAVKLVDGSTPKLRRG